MISGLGSPDPLPIGEFAPAIPPLKTPGVTTGTTMGRVSWPFWPFSAVFSLRSLAAEGFWLPARSPVSQPLSGPIAGAGVSSGDL